MSRKSSDPGEQHKSSDALAVLIVAACERDDITCRAFSVQDYAVLPPFNWDISAHEECAAVHLIDQTVCILHVASVRDNDSLVYRAKTLFPSPASVLESPDYHGGAFSVSFGGDAGGHWKSDCKTELGQAVAEVLTKDCTLTDLLLSAGHSNVNAWLEDSKPVSYIAVNTGKRYSSATEVVDFVSVSKEIAGRIQAGPGLVWKVSSL